MRVKGPRGLNNFMPKSDAKSFDQLGDLGCKLFAHRRRLDLSEFLDYEFRTVRVCQIIQSSEGDSSIFFTRRKCSDGRR